MKRIMLIAAVVMVGVLLASCATGDSLAFDEGEPMLAGGPLQKDVWDENSSAAELTAGVAWEGRTALEIAQPYGNSFMVWHFSNLKPNEPVQVTLDVWVDAVANDSWVEFLWAPGLIPATAEGVDAIKTNPEKEGGFYYKWDSGGADMGIESEGWMTLTDNSQIADAEGNFSVGIWMGHWSSNPPVVNTYVDNLTVGTVQ
jgi:hypothetical protein